MRCFHLKTEEENMLKISEIKPPFTSILVTGNKFEKDVIEHGIIVAKKGDLKLWQVVLAVGSSVKEFAVGDKVMINAANFEVRKYSKDSIQNDIDNNPIKEYNFNWVTIDGEDGETKECLLMSDRDILYSFVGEEVEDPEESITPIESSLILPKKKTILVN